MHAIAVCSIGAACGPTKRAARSMRSGTALHVIAAASDCTTVRSDRRGLRRRRPCGRTAVSAMAPTTATSAFADYGGYVWDPIESTCPSAAEAGCAFIRGTWDDRTSSCSRTGGLTMMRLRCGPEPPLFTGPYRNLGRRATEPSDRARARAARPAG